MKRFRTLIAICAIAGAAMATTPGHAEEQYQKTYDSSAVVVSCTPCVGFYIGGVRFTAAELEGSSPVSMRVDDLSGTVVSFQACQDIDNDRFCGETGEPSYDGCGQGDISSIEWDPTKDITVFIETIGACSGIATTGTVTLTVA